MAFVAPDLITTVGKTTYETDIDGNFVAIQQALNDIETELPSLNDALESYLTSFAQEVALTSDHEGLLPVASGALETAGVIIPFDCEIVRGYVLAKVAPGAGASASIVWRSGATAITGAVSITSSDAGTVKNIAGLSTLAQVLAGTWIRPYTTNTGDPSACSDLTFVLVIRKPLLS